MKKLGQKKGLWVQQSTRCFCAGRSYHFLVSLFKVRLRDVERKHAETVVSSVELPLSNEVLLMNKLATMNMSCVTESEYP